MGNSKDDFYEVGQASAVNVDPPANRIQSFEADALSVRMFDVGKGEAILVEVPTGETMLVDGGSTTGEKRNRILADVIAPYIREGSLTAFLATHPHVDHVGAIRYLLEYHRDRLANGVTFYYNGKPPRNPDATWWSELNDAINDAGVRRVAVDQLIYPAPPPLGRLAVVALYSGPLGPNEYRSVFMHLSYGQAQFLFTGDAYCAYENKLARDYAAKGVLRAHVLKVTHHGSQDGTSRALVQEAGPRIAFASTYYDQRAKEQDHAWERVAKRRLPGCRKIETFLHGDIDIRTDGQPSGAGVLFQARTRYPGRLAAPLGLPLTRPRSYTATAATTDKACTNQLP